MGSETGAFESARAVIPVFSPAGTLTLDQNGTVTAMNDLAAELLSVDRDETVGTPLFELLSDESGHRLEEHLVRAEAGERPATCEVTLTAADGRTKHMLVQTVAGAPDDAESAYQTALIDLTYYVERIQDAERGRVSAERVARSKTDFLARLSHEIRSALASMIGFADLLKESVPEANRELTEIIRDSGLHLLDTLNSVMDLARLEFQKGDLELSEIDVVQRVERRMAGFEKLAASRGIGLSFRGESETAVARLNGTFLDRVVHNLVDNAIKYTPEGKVEVHVEERDGSVWIYVADTGVGIQNDFMPRLFSPFEREKREDAKSAEGVGLGLAITKYLVELMGGRVVACSTPGEGSTFTVSFPSCGPSAEQAPPSDG